MTAMQVAVLGLERERICGLLPLAYVDLTSD